MTTWAGLSPGWAPNRSASASPFVSRWVCGGDRGKHAETTRVNRQHQPYPHGAPCQWDVRGLPSSARTPATPAVPGLPPDRAQILDENGLLMTLPDFLGPGCPCSTSEWRLSRKKGNSSRPCGCSRGAPAGSPRLLAGRLQGGHSDPRGSTGGCDQHAYVGMRGPVAGHLSAQVPRAHTGTPGMPG